MLSCPNNTHFGIFENHIISASQHSLIFCRDAVFVLSLTLCRRISSVRIKQTFPTTSANIFCIWISETIKSDTRPRPMLLWSVFALKIWLLNFQKPYALAHRKFIEPDIILAWPKNATSKKATLPPGKRDHDNVACSTFGHLECPCPTRSHARKKNPFHTGQTRPRVG